MHPPIIGDEEKNSEKVYHQHVCRIYLGHKHRFECKYCQGRYNNKAEDDRKRDMVWLCDKNIYVLSLKTICVKGIHCNKKRDEFVVFTIYGRKLCLFEFYNILTQIR